MVRTIEPTSSVNDVCIALEEDGAVIVRNMVSSDLMDRVWNELEPAILQSPTGEDKFSGFQTTRTTGLFAKTRLCAELVVHPLFLGASEQWLLPHCESILISESQAIRVGPGSPPQSLHRDDGMYLWKHPGSDSVMSIMYAVTDFTEDNGATWVVPGSHKLDDQAVPNREQAVQAIMPKGSGLIWLGSTFHGAGENKTADQFRTGLLFGYCLGYLRQTENMYLVVPLDVVKQYPEKFQRLLGYSLHGRFLGYVEWEQDLHRFLVDQQA